MSLPLQNTRTLGSARLELGKPSLIHKTDRMLERSAYPALHWQCTQENTQQEQAFWQFSSSTDILYAWARKGQQD